MHIDPALAEWVRSPAEMALAQGRLLAARDAWAKRADVAPVLRDCAVWGRGSGFSSCTALAGLMQGSAAREFASGWFAAMANGWREAPLAQMPFRHSYGGGVAALHIHRVDRVTLAILLVEPLAAHRPHTVAFTDCERHEVVIAGRGEAIAFECDGAGPPSITPFAIGPGTTFSGHAGRSRAITTLAEPLVLLRAARDPVSPQPTREVAIGTGEVVHRASACPAEGRVELAAALLGAMGRGDAAPALARYASGNAGEGARWEALRNALALDTKTGMAALCRIADDRADPLSGEAVALRAHLFTAYPQLANWVERTCPA